MMEISLSNEVKAQLITSFFFFFALLSVGGGVFVLVTRNILYAAFSLLMSFLGLAGLFVLAGADFVAVTQVMVYIGGILVLLIFGIMLTRPMASGETENHPVSWWGIVSALLFFCFLLLYLMNAHFALDGSEVKEPVSGVRPLGLLLLTEYVSLFEIIGVLLLVALVGSAYVARYQVKSK